MSCTVSPSSGKSYGLAPVGGFAKNIARGSAPVRVQSCWKTLTFMAASSGTMGAACGEPPLSVSEADCFVEASELDERRGHLGARIH
jgi:hypothetical protein